MSLPIFIRLFKKPPKAYFLISEHEGLTVMCRALFPATTQGNCNEEDVSFPLIGSNKGTLEDIAIPSGKCTLQYHAVFGVFLKGLSLKVCKR